MSVTRFIAGLLAVCAVAAATVALWPASEADKARDDGEQVGQAVNHLPYADSTEEVNDALDELSSQASDFQTNAPEVEQAFWEGVDSGLNAS